MYKEQDQVPLMGGTQGLEEQEQEQEGDRLFTVQPVVPSAFHLCIFIIYLVENNVILNH